MGGRVGGGQVKKYKAREERGGDRERKGQNSRMFVCERE